jgi:glycine cleavage system transcriptional repressor
LIKIGSQYDQLEIKIRSLRGMRMERKFVMTAFCKDRPGIVADITEIIFQAGCNLEDSTMTSILDEFAIILLFSGKGDNLEEPLLKDCRRLERDKGITAFLRPVEIKDKKSQKRIYTKTINVDGVDQSGIVYKVSRFLADDDINIESLTSKRLISPETGTAIYAMDIKVQIPEKISLEQLEKGLSQVGEELNVEIVIG